MGERNLVAAIIRLAAAFKKARVPTTGLEIVLSIPDWRAMFHVMDREHNDLLWSSNPNPLVAIRLCGIVFKPKSPVDALALFKAS